MVINRIKCRRLDDWIIIRSLLFRWAMSSLKLWHQTLTQTLKLWGHFDQPLKVIWRLSEEIHLEKFYRNRKTFCSLLSKYLKNFWRNFADMLNSRFFFKIFAEILKTFNWHFANLIYLLKCQQNFWRYSYGRKKGSKRQRGQDDGNLSNATFDGNQLG